MQVIGVLNKKGGAGKTTTTIGLAVALSRKGVRVGIIDTDPNGSASRWLETGGGIDHVPCTPDDLAAMLESGVLSDDYDVILVDSPPNDVAAIKRIAEVADLAVIPVAPTPIEVDQLPDTVDLIEASSTPWLVVPVRVRMSTSAGRTIRQMCADLGIPATRSVVPLSEAVARSFGEQPPTLPFLPLSEEILNQLAALT